MHYKTTTKPRPINEIKIGDDRIMTIDVGCGWAVTDVWFDHDIPVDLIDCVKVKFERKETPQMKEVDTVNHSSHYETEEVTRYCSDNAPRQCLNEKCAQAEVFKDKLYCTATLKWYDLTPKAPEDIVNHPPHYNQGGLECIDVIAAMLGPEGTKDYCIGNVQKYIFRHKNKNGIEDLEKAQWYLNYRINMEEKTHEPNEPK